MFYLNNFRKSYARARKNNTNLWKIHKFFQRFLVVFFTKQLPLWIRLSTSWHACHQMSPCLINWKTLHDIWWHLDGSTLWLKKELERSFFMKAMWWQFMTSYHLVNLIQRITNSFHTLQNTEGQVQKKRSALSVMLFIMISAYKSTHGQDRRIAILLPWS